MAPDNTLTILSEPHQLFLQRFMAEIVMCDSDAKHLYAQALSTTQGRCNMSDGVDDKLFLRFLGTLSKALRDNFDLEIRTLNISNDIVQQNISQIQKTTTIYHGIVNRSSDNSAKLYGAPDKNPHELSFLRLIFEHMIDDGNSRAAETSCDLRRPIIGGCNGSLTATEIINLRNELRGPHENKLNAQECEKALNKFVQEKWLVKIFNQGDQVPHRRCKENDRYQLGPRTYMELEPLLKELGLSNIPQAIIHTSK